MNSHHQNLGANMMQQQTSSSTNIYPTNTTTITATTSTSTTSNNNNMTTGIASLSSSTSNNHLHSLKPLNMVTPHYSEMKSYSLNQPYSSLPSTNSSITSSLSSSTANSNNTTSLMQSSTTSSKMYNNSDSYPQHGNIYQSSPYPSIQSNIHTYNNTPSSTNNTISSSNNPYPNSSMLPQNSSYQQTYYTSSSFQATPTSHHYSSSPHVSTTSRQSPTNNYSSTNNIQSSPSVTVATSPSVHSMWSTQEKLPNMKDIFGGPNIVNTWSSSSSKQERLPSLMDEAKKSETPIASYNSYSNQTGSNLISHSSTSHVTNNSNLEHVMEELQQKLRQQDVIIKRLEKENIRLKSELDSYNRSIANQSNIVKASSPKKRKISTEATAGNMEMKSQSSISSNSSQTDQYSNSNEDMSDALDDEDEDEFEDGVDGKSSKKRKQPSNLVRSKKTKDESNKKPKSSRTSGRRDATVGDLEKYTVTWKGETYVLVNAFKNRTQILNYYVPLYQNNFPEKTCKLVLCNDEYKVLSSENPNTVEKKKHAWRVSVFTMDFYNFVKNFDKRTLKIINSSSGFIPNVNFEGSASSPVISSPSIVRSANYPTNFSNQNTSPNALLADNRRTQIPNLQPTLLPPPNISSSNDINSLDMAPKPISISTIHNK